MVSLIYKQFWGASGCCGCLVGVVALWVKGAIGAATAACCISSKRHLQYHVVELSSTNVKELVKHQFCTFEESTWGIMLLAPSCLTAVSRSGIMEGRWVHACSEVRV